MLPRLGHRSRSAAGLLGFTALSLLFLHWYAGIANVLYPSPSHAAERVGKTPGSSDEAKIPPADAPTLKPPPKDNRIVMARLMEQDVDWVTEELPEYVTHSQVLNATRLTMECRWSSAIYTVDDPNAALKTPKNKGNEAMVYLTYLIDNYDNLPQVSAFLHPHRDGYPRAWHTDAENYSNVISIRTLRLDTVLNRGYVNLRCNWIPGCPDEIQPFRTTDAHRSAEHEFQSAWKYMFGNSSSSPDVPDVVGAACCAQFAVSKKQILERQKSEYETYRNWLLDTPLDDAVSGRIFEYLWHIIFGAPAVL